MRDVTEYFQDYRMAARSMWNLFFRPKPDMRDWDARDSFNDLAQHMFRVFILERLENNSVEAPTAGSFFVVPRAQIPIMIESPRPNDRNHYWDHEVNRVAPQEMELRFLNFFDWDHLGYLDFTYVHTVIVSAPNHLDLIGRKALLEFLNVQIIWKTDVDRSPI